MGIILWQLLKTFNLFMYLDSETMKMFSMRARNKSKYQFVATKVYKTLSPKIQNEDFAYRVNQDIYSLDYGNVTCSFSENLLSKVIQNCHVLMLTLPVPNISKIHFKITSAKMIVYTSLEYLKRFW